MDNKQTAVEWLMEQITYDNGYGQRWISFKEATDLNIYFEDAKAMEKEQIKDAVNYGCSDWGSFKDAEQYYNETYGN
jgi:hypothetical protein